MSKRSNERAAKKAKKKRLGFCHGCGHGWTELTWEHIPPLRVQSLIPKEYLRFNPLDKIRSETKSNRKLPPCVVAPGGLKVKSFGVCCQQLTQKHYGQAFFEWSGHGLSLCRNLSYGQGRIQGVFDIKPLNVLKQIASITLASAPFDTKPVSNRLRQFIQRPNERLLPAGVDFYIYLNPLMPDYKLPQCRLQRQVALVRNVVTGGQAFVLAEVSVPPFGYIVLLRDDAPLYRSVGAMMNINHFADGYIDKSESVAVDLPVLTPFGPAPLRYIQDDDSI